MAYLFAAAFMLVFYLCFALAMVSEERLVSGIIALLCYAGVAFSIWKGRRDKAGEEKMPIKAADRSEER